MRRIPTIACAVARTSRLVLLPALVLLASGCNGPEDRYSIQLVPRGDSLERSVRIERVQTHEDSLRHALSPHLDPALTSMLVAAYGVPVDTTATRPYAASRRFAGIPDDVGTTGSYRHWSSPLGESGFYAERIRGMEDAPAYVAGRFAAADTFATFFAGWLRFELVTQPEYPRASAWIDGELARIARTVVAASLVAPGQDSVGEGWMLSLAAEHPLFVIEAMPLLVSEGSAHDGDDPAVADPYLARARAELSRRLGLRSAADEARVLGFLANGAATLASYRRYLASSPAVHAVDSAEWIRLEGAMADAPLGGGESLFRVELRLPARPFQTNGRWDADRQCVTWSASRPALALRETSLPLACAAVWCVPDTAAQKRLFGAAILDGADLFAYNDWFATLAAGQQAEWDRMLLGLRPGRLGALERFRFAAAGAPGAAATGAYDAAAHTRTLLASRLAATARPPAPTRQPPAAAAGKPR